MPLQYVLACELYFIVDLVPTVTHEPLVGLYFELPMPEWKHETTESWVDHITQSYTIYRTLSSSLHL